jgi:fructokinase
MVAGVEALRLTTDTLADPDTRSGTEAARERALAEGRPVVLDARLDLEGWRSRTDAIATLNAVVPGALLVFARPVDAELLTGERDPATAAGAFVKAGARLALLGLGADGALLRGEESRTFRGAIGDEDRLLDAVLARLERAGWYPPAAAAALLRPVA